MRKFIKIYKFKGNSHDTFFVLFFVLLDVLMPVKIGLIEASFLSRISRQLAALKEHALFKEITIVPSSLWNLPSIKQLQDSETLHTTMELLQAALMKETGLTFKFGI